MFLAIDIGNTATSIGFFRDHVLGGSFTIPSRTDATDTIENEILKLIEQRLVKKNDIFGVGISSVVPTLTEFYCAMVIRNFGVEPKVLSHAVDLDFRVLYDDPAQLGTDRLANVIASRKLYGYPALVIDLGTASKYDVIDKNGDYLGGLIAPGIGTGAQALFEKGALLFSVELEKPEKLIGTTTAEALQSGIYNGFLGQIIYLKDRIRQELGYPSLKIVATGGYTQLFGEYQGLFDVVDMGLTLKGLEIALNR